MKNNTKTTNINIKYIFCILHVTFCILQLLNISCSSFKIKNLPNDIPLIQKSLFTAHMSYQRNYISSNEITPPLRLKWEKKFDTLANQGFSIFNNLLMFCDNKGKVNFINSLDGENTGSIKLKGIGSIPPTIYNNIIYQSCETGKYGLLAYDLTSGTILWLIKKNYSRSSPVVYNKKVFHQTIKGEIFCYNYYNGEEIWQISIDSDVYNSLALENNILFSASLNGKICSIENSSGIIIWEKILANSIIANPVIENNKLYIAGYTGILYILNLKTGKIIDEIKFNVPLYFGPSIDNKNIYIALSNGKIVAIEKSTLQQIWSHSGKGPPSGSPLVTDTYIYFTTMAKKLYILDKKNGKELQKIELTGRGQSTPIIYNNSLIIACEKKHVVSFEETKSP